MTIQLDQKDMQLLYWLDVDGRMSYTQLGKRTRMSKQRVKYRVERLENEGIIKGYYAMVDTSRLGYTTFRVYLKLKGLKKERREQIISALCAMGSVWAVVLLAGKWDVALGVSAKHIHEFYEAWERILTQFLPEIADYAVHIYSPILHYNKAYLIDEKDDSEPRILGGKETAEFDETDLEILRALAPNARTTLVDLAPRTSLTAEGLSGRMRRLEKKGIIQGYRAMIDVAALGYEFYKAELRLRSYVSIASMQRFCQQHPNIYQLDHTIGGETLEIEFHVKSLQQMLSIIQEMEEQFPDLIERFDYITVLAERKTTYMPSN